MRRDDEDADSEEAEGALADRDLPREEDMDADLDETATEPCPYCKKPIIEDSEWCHHCGSYLSQEDTPRQVPLWLLIGATLIALGMTSWIVMGW